MSKTSSGSMRKVLSNLYSNVRVEIFRIFSAQSKGEKRVNISKKQVPVLIQYLLNTLSLVNNDCNWFTQIGLQTIRPSNVNKGKGIPLLITKLVRAFPLGQPLRIHPFVTISQKSFFFFILYAARYGHCFPFKN